MGGAAIYREHISQALTRVLMFILSIVLRVFMLIEFVVRRELQAQHDTLANL
jgi:hypothetical protein